MAIASRILRDANVQDLILSYVADLSPEIYTIVDGILSRNVQDTSSILATIVSTAILLWGATGGFNHLKLLHIRASFSAMISIESVEKSLFSDFEVRK